MKTIGLIGGLSWESTAVYYKLINERVRAERGGLRSAPILLYSFDFAEIVRLQQSGAWTEAAEVMSQAGRQLCGAGADCLAICTNTMHKVAAEVAEAAGVPLIHIGDATGQAVRAAGIQRIALLGTRYTMEQPFLAGYMAERYGLDVLIPSEEDRTIVHSVIFDELCQGTVCPESREKLEQVAIRLRDEQGAEGVILGCTELMLLIGEESGPFPLRRFDTTELHARAVTEYALRSFEDKSVVSGEAFRAPVAMVG